MSAIEKISKEYELTFKGRAFLFFSDRWLWRFDWYKNFCGRIFFKNFSGHADLQRRKL